MIWSDFMKKEEIHFPYWLTIIIEQGKSKKYQLVKKILGILEDL